MGTAFEGLRPDPDGRGMGCNASSEDGRRVDLGKALREADDPEQGAAPLPREDSREALFADGNDRRPEPATDDAHLASQASSSPSRSAASPPTSRGTPLLDAGSPQVVEAEVTGEVGSEKSLDRLLPGPREPPEPPRRAPGISWCFSLFAVVFVVAAGLLALFLRRLGHPTSAADAFEVMQRERWQWRDADDPWWEPGDFVLMTETSTNTSTTETTSTTTMTVTNTTTSTTVTFTTQKPSGPVEFYMYRAQSWKDYPIENVDTADLEGVLWYLHNEVMVMCPRKYDIVRIKRMKVTVQYPFGPFTAFDYGMCTVPNCGTIFAQWGFRVGCQPRPYATTSPHGKWFSLPGACPLQKYMDKTPACKSAQPGGKCASAGDVWNQVGTCTYHIEDAGQVDISEVTGINKKFGSYENFCAKGGLEYDKPSDRGKLLSFWDHFNLATSGDWRMEQFRQAFKAKYPSMPADLAAPVCA